MSRYNTVLYNWTEVTNRLMRDKQLLAHFLRFSAGMYKQSFPDAALIYQQNPKATKVATLEVWNKLGRMVNRGERSIAVFGEECQCRHLFDITQTNGKRIPALWNLDEGLSAELTAVINEKYNVESQTVQETIAAVSVDNLKCRLADMQEIAQQMRLSEKQNKVYQQSVISAVRYMVSCRCELESEMQISGGLNLNAVDLFRDTRDLIRFCDLVQRTAKDSLLEIEREVFQILKKRREQSHELQAQPDRAIPDRNAVYGRSEGAGTPAPPDQKMGQKVAGVDENRTPDGSTDPHHGGTVADHSEGDRPAGGKPVDETGRTISQGTSTTDRLPADTGVGNHPDADIGAQAHGGSRIPDPELTIEVLKQRYLHADFNRRLDSYETAGLAFTDSEELPMDAVTFFNRFHADKFSAVQAEEIRSIMTVAIHNRDKMQAVPEETIPAEIQAETSLAEPPKPEPAALTEPEPEETEPVIIHNFPLISGDLPALEDEAIISGILTHDQFYVKKCDEITAFFAEHTDTAERTEFLKTAFNADYSEFDVGSTRVGYKTADTGLIIWEGSSYLSRTREAGLSWEFLEACIAGLIEENRYLSEPALHRNTQDADKNQLVIYSFTDDGGVITADCSMGGKDFSAPILRTEQDIPYINHNGKPVKLNDVQAYDLEQFELYRTPVTHDRNGYYADDLDTGDTIRLDGTLWTVASKSEYPSTAANCFAAVNYSDMSYAKAVSYVQSGAFYATDQASLSVTNEVAEELYQLHVPLRGCEGFNHCYDVDDLQASLDDGDAIFVQDMDFAVVVHDLMKHPEWAAFRDSVCQKFGDMTAYLPVATIKELWEKHEIQKLHTELQDKIRKEHSDFLNDLREESPDNIIRSAYTIVTTDQISMYMRLHEPPLSAKEYKALLSSDNALTEIYEEWLSHDEWSDIQDVGYAMKKAAESIQYALEREKEAALQKLPVSKEPEQTVKPNPTNKPRR